MNEVVFKRTWWLIVTDAKQWISQHFLISGYRFCAPEVILCQSVSVCQQLASFPQTLFNSPFLSSETKSLSLTLTAKKKKKIKSPRSLKAEMADDSCSVQFLSDPRTWWYARIGVWLSCFIDPVWDWFSSGQAFFWPPITPSPWGCRHIIVGANRESLLKPLSVCVCVTQDNNTVIRSSTRTPGWQRGNEMETLTEKDPPLELEKAATKRNLLASMRQTPTLPERSSAELL